MLGEVVGWFIGWDLLLEYTAIVAVVAIGVSQYITFLLDGLGVDLPAWMLGAPGTGAGHRVDLFAVLLCLLRGLAAQPRHQDQRAGSRPGWSSSRSPIVLAVIVVGRLLRQDRQLTPYFPFGFGGVATGAATVFFAVFGYDAMSTAAEESKDGRAQPAQGDHALAGHRDGAVPAGRHRC